MPKDNYKLTELQQDYLAEKMKHPNKKQKDIMESIGHDTTAINEKALLTKMVKNDDPRIHLFEKYISLEKCLIVCSEAMSAERHSKFGSYPDHQTRLKAVESASRIAGYVQPDQTNINIVVLNALEDLKNELGTVEIN